MYATADLVDAFEAELTSCPVQFTDYGGRIQFFGPVRTLSCRLDNALLKKTVGTPSKGEVLVVDGGGLLTNALVGDLIAGSAAENGWAGLIVNGAIRDVEAMSKVNLGLKALGSNPMKSAKTGAGKLDAPIAIGGVTFTPGDWVYADRDGVLVAKTPIHLRLKN